MEGPEPTRKKPAAASEQDQSAQNESMVQPADERPHADDLLRGESIATDRVYDLQVERADGEAPVHGHSEALTQFFEGFENGHLRNPKKYPALMELYFQNSAIERMGNGAIFRLLGVKHFKKWLPHMPMSTVKPNAVDASVCGYDLNDPRERRLLALARMEQFTRSNELLQLNVGAACLIGCLVASATMAQTGPTVLGGLFAGGMAFGFIAAGVVPVLYHRFNRFRIMKHLDCDK